MLVNSEGSFSLGKYRKLTLFEKQKYNEYKYVVIEPYIYETFEGQKITVLNGFLTNGANYIWDVGSSWIVHDYLYSTHQFDNRETCTREEADEIMSNILTLEKRYVLRFFFDLFSTINPFGIFTHYYNKNYIDYIQ
jgi:hypothetical protein